MRHTPCGNPLWPCAMTGAVACLAGFEDLAVIVHGSSGCYFYPASLVGVPIHGTFLVENEVIFGTEPRLQEVIGELEDRYARIAVVNTCVPAIMGEDIGSLTRDGRVFIVDSPGFLGDLEVGYHQALAEIAPEVDPGVAGVNIDGICRTDPFYRGNTLEARRLLNLAGTTVATTFCLDRYAATHRAAPLTVGTNPDLASGVGRWCGSLLGLDAIAGTVDALAAAIEGIETRPVREEIAWADARIRKACGKYLRRFDPPRVAIFAGRSYADFAAGMLKQYLDADIVHVAARNDADARAADFSVIRETIRDAEPDLILGSSYEQTLAGDAAFVGMTPPLRDRILLHSRAVAGVEGALWLMDEVLNACTDRNRRIRGGSMTYL
ncbi:MAG TPA: nitrogenase component 1 [Candidatus Methanoculleus thermohydrogenotrophicum]|jgi:nitrogenase molybdenum-iron protein alpha/beta subunit|nr:nitrogenase component 1 [Candidatus Methanoculleus thermohydrogenotrophicum]NLM82447.1 oxidoreductase [Candidatus Methanoculleus thermohydrogenotrophicum]HOB18489.1 nitrogenase component 1 [Candidatus Methanoculleus thermohydrogenotrophicum]HPZ38608.1 nitrogenase component 1 [Candidatus Methanoculleus thermohydrogenotrophicum]HQC91753.1 nitrogenase component 1 [Candidatus Methanoculleus thermohydrogenotrophicum]